MIPKIIHYCWFGAAPLPKSAIKCINSWKKFFPDYEIKQWDETNFDINEYCYTQEAYKAGKYAFVSDFVRFWVLYNYGGVYFDTDVEVIKSFSHLAESPFMGFELNPYNEQQRPMRVNPGLGVGVTPKHPVYEQLLDLYKSMHWVSYAESNREMPTIVDYTTNLLITMGLKECEGIQNIMGINIYPECYFCPININSGKLCITDNTYSIHWFDQSWQSPLRKYGRKLILLIGGPVVKDFIKKILRLK